MQSIAKIVAVFLCTVCLPCAAYAQASIAGAVTDPSGGVLPGVTVEATSPELIEKVRSVVTDGTGQFRIENLRPGEYAVTFTLPGFAVVRREGIQLTGSFTATLNVEMRVGGLEETLTVTGETPIVDVQSARREQTMSADVIKTIPSARQFNSLAVLVPGLTASGTQDVGGILGTFSPSFQIHGGRSGEGRLQVDGVSVGASLGAGGTSGYMSDVGNAQEVNFTTSGGLGESDVSGLVINVVPRQGGNAMSGTFFGSWAGSSMQAGNFTPELRAAGLLAPNSLIKIWDTNAAVGGPIAKDRLWYFATARHQGNEKYVTNMWENLNAGDPNAWTYQPDLSKPARNDGIWKQASARMTWQVTPRNKINFFWDEQSICQKCGSGGTSTISPEADTESFNFPSRVQQATWTSPISNKVLAEAGFGTVLIHWGFREHENNPELVRVTEQAGAIPGLTYRSQDWRDGWIGVYNWRGALSYVTGSTSVKVGHVGAFLVNDQTTFTNDQRLSYRLNNGVPNQLTMIAVQPPGGDQVLHSRAAWYGAYAQAQWKQDRLSLQGALRFDRAWSYYPEQQIGPDRFLPTAIVFPRSDGVKGYNDISPRGGAAYDLFGTGRTSVKVNGGRYLEAVSNYANYTLPSPTARFAGTTTRSWTDANRDYVPDCDLMNPALNGECGPWANQGFGNVAFSSAYDPAILQGWGVRPWDWQFGASVQHALLPSVSVELAYHRRWFGNFTVTDNQALMPGDFDAYSVTAPSDPRLPGGGGHVIGPLYDVNPAKFGQVNNYITYAENYGSQTQTWNGFDLNINARSIKSVTLQGGLTTGQTVTDNCEIRQMLTESYSLNPYCHVESGYLTQLSGLASYTIPRIDLMVSGTFQSKPGAQLAANYVVPNAVIAPSLGRNLAGGAANVVVNLVEPGTLFGDRLNQVDMRVAKMLRYGQARLQIGLDVYNLLNSSAVQTYNQSYGPNWLTPTLVMPGRFARISGQLDF